MSKKKTQKAKPSSKPSTPPRANLPPIATPPMEVVVPPTTEPMGPPIPLPEGMPKMELPAEMPLAPPVPPMSQVIPPEVAPKIRELASPGGIDQTVEVGGVVAATSGRHAMAMGGKNPNHPQSAPSSIPTPASPVCPSTPPQARPSVGVPPSPPIPVSQPGDLGTGPGLEIEVLMQKLTRVETAKLVRGVIAPSPSPGPSKWSPDFRAELHRHVLSRVTDPAWVSTVCEGVLRHLRPSWAPLHACRCIAWLAVSEAMIELGGISDYEDAFAPTGKEDAYA